MADNLASQARDPQFSPAPPAPGHSWRHLREHVVRLAAICAVGWSLCLVIRASRTFCVAIVCIRARPVRLFRITCTSDCNIYVHLLIYEIKRIIFYRLPTNKIIN